MRLPVTGRRVFYLLEFKITYSTRICAVNKLIYINMNKNANALKKI